MFFRKLFVVLFLTGIIFPLFSQQTTPNYASPDPKNCEYDEKFGAYHCYNPNIKAHYYYYADGTYFYPGSAVRTWKWDRSHKWWGMGTREPYHHDYYPYYQHHRDSPYRNNRNRAYNFERPFPHHPYRDHSDTPYNHEGRHHPHRGYHYEYQEHPLEDSYSPSHQYGWWWNGQTWQWGLGHNGHHAQHRGRQLRDDQIHHSPYQYQQ